MNEHEHFTRFREKHKQRMLAERTIEREPHTRSNGHDASETMQETLLDDGHLPEHLPTNTWLRESLRRIWGHMVVKKPEDGTYHVSKGTAALFISAFLSCLIMGGLGLLWQRDEIVRLRTIQEMQDKTNVDMLSKIDQARATAQIADRNAARLEGKFDQFSLQVTVGNPKKNPQPMLE